MSPTSEKVPWLLITRPDLPPSKYEIILPCTTVGRSEGNNLEFPFSTVSSFHCEIRKDEYGLSLRDLGSTNGTILNNKKVQDGSASDSGIALKYGDKIQVGHVTLEVIDLSKANKESFSKYLLFSLVLSLFLILILAVVTAKYYKAQEEVQQLSESLTPKLALKTTSTLELRDSDTDQDNLNQLIAQLKCFEVKRSGPLIVLDLNVAGHSKDEIQKDFETILQNYKNHASIYFLGIQDSSSNITGYQKAPNHPTADTTTLKLLDILTKRGIDQKSIILVGGNVLPPTSNLRLIYIPKVTIP